MSLGGIRLAHQTENVFEKGKMILQIHGKREGRNMGWKALSKASEGREVAVLHLALGVSCTHTKAPILHSEFGSVCGTFPL